MLSNLILIVITLVVLAFIGMLWMRFRLLQEITAAEHQLALLRVDLEKRRDTVPLLLESIRRREHMDERWQIVLNKRADFHQVQALSREWDFEKILLDYIDSLELKDVDFLAAKKDVNDLTSRIQNAYEKYQGRVDHANQLRKRFPFSVASAIFGLREISA